MRGRTMFRVAGGLALLGMVAAGVAAVLTGAVGVAALSGRISYPYAVKMGPVHAEWRMTLPVAGSGDICQRASVSDPGPSTCYRFFLHQASGAGGQDTRRQDADVRPSQVELSGQADLVTTPGWSPYVAAFVLQRTVTLLGAAVLLYLLWQILRATAAGNAFTPLTVRRLRLIAAILLAGALAGPILGGLARTDVLGYWSESFGAYPGLQPRPDLALSATQVAVALVLFLVVEVVQHGTMLEDEARATV